MNTSGIRSWTVHLSPKHKMLIVLIVVIMLAMVLALLSVVGVLALAGAAIAIGARLVYKARSLPGAIKNRLSMKKNKEIKFDPSQLEDLR